MARRLRIELEGGLYHIIARGNDRRTIFHSDNDHKKFLSLLEAQKERLPFFLYSYCMMTNHVHLLIERRADSIGRIMHRVLTGYSQYYNRRYRKVGHLFQGRHKAILCQSDMYLAELVRYIHLNPVRAKMVRKAEHYAHSSQRAYLGLEPAGIIDIDPVLRLFAARKKVARERFAEYVTAGMKLGHREEFYLADEGCILGSEEFVDDTIHRIGDSGRKPRANGRERNQKPREFDREALIAAVENVCGISRETFCGPGKNAQAVMAKEALILAGRAAGASMSTLSQITGLSSSTVSRRHDAAIRRMQDSEGPREATAEVTKQYLRTST